MFQIPLPNFEYEIDNVLAVCFVFMFSENTLLLACFDKEQRGKMFIERRVMERHLLGGKGTLIFLVKYFESSLKTIQHN